VRDLLESIVHAHLGRRRLRLRHSLFLLIVTATTLGAQAPIGGARYVNSPDLAPPPGYSHAVVVDHGKIVYLSGAVALDKQGTVVGPNDFKAQAQQAFVNLASALKAAGATPASVVKLNYYVVGLDHDKLLALREIRDSFIDRAHPPASTLIGVQALARDEFMIEIEAVAVLP
jgi:2-iminobutanoate/2-iminopropanoate deaminase